jgi:ATP phosphoribosyltransferase regulatory subunit
LEAQQALKECLLNRDYVGYRDTIKSLDLASEVEKELEGILRLRGGQEICAQAKQVTKDPTAQQSIAHLCEVWDVLKAYGVSEHVLIDLTMIGDFSYYTGMTFEGYAADLGFPVCSGGRYDNLLTQFGRPAPATGFALKTNRILEVVSKQPTEVPERILVAYSAASREEAFAKAKELRSREGVMVETRLVDGVKIEAVRLDDASYRVNGVVYQDVIQLG